MDFIAKAVTLKSIKLHDPSAKELLFSAKHSVLYTFDSCKNSWDKTETEGCLAIYKQQSGNNNNPFSTVLFILNRLRPDNYSCPLSKVRSIQLEGELLMLLRSDNEIMGIWLFDEKERQLALNILQTLLSSDMLETTAQLKPISFTDLLGVSLNEHSKNKNINSKTCIIDNNNNNNIINNPTPTILDILSKAKIRDPTDHDYNNNNNNNNNNTLAIEIKNHFSNLTIDSGTSLKDFTNQTCEFLRANPQLLAALYQDLVLNRLSKS